MRLYSSLRTCYVCVRWNWITDGRETPYRIIASATNLFQTQQFQTSGDSHDLPQKSPLPSLDLPLTCRLLPPSGDVVHLSDTHLSDIPLVIQACPHPQSVDARDRSTYGSYETASSSSYRMACLLLNLLLISWRILWPLTSISLSSAGVVPASISISVMPIEPYIQAIISILQTKNKCSLYDLIRISPCYQI